MGKKIYLKTLLLAIFLLAFLPYSPGYVNSQQQIYIKANPVVLKSTLSISPSSAAVLNGSTFDVSVILDSRKNSINTIELNIKFPADKLEIVKPAKDKSIFGIWIAPPVYSNTGGTANFSGIIPNGITTSSGVVVTMTFKAKNTGQAAIKISPTSRILANDGLGTEVSVDLSNGNFTINPIPPAGPEVFSNSHPFEDKWYNNKNAIVGWGEGDKESTEYSYILDNKPFTVPDDISEGGDRTKVYENLGDGLWYFHIKAKKEGVWGAATNFLLSIDTTPPAAFKITLEYLTAAIIGRNIISFFTTDALSGIDHYEVGIIDKESAPTESPVFIQTESPYQVPNLVSSNLRIVVRAFDNAGNVRDEYINTNGPFSFIKNNFIFIIIFAIIIFAIFGIYFVRKYFLKLKFRNPPQAQPPKDIVRQFAPELQQETQKSPPASLVSFSVPLPPLPPVPIKNAKIKNIKIRNIKIN